MTCSYDSLSGLVVAAIHPAPNQHVAGADAYTGRSDAARDAGIGTCAVPTKSHTPTLPLLRGAAINARFVTWNIGGGSRPCRKYGNYREKREHAANTIQISSPSVPRCLRTGFFPENRGTGHPTSPAHTASVRRLTQDSQRFRGVAYFANESHGQ